MKNRIAYYDVLRGVAILLVVAIHALNYADMGDHEAPSYMIFAYKVSISFAVPLFVTLSGFFLTTENLLVGSEYKEYLKRQLPRILIPYLVWAILYSAMNYKGVNSLGYAFFKVLTFQVVSPFYFIFLILQLYLLAPMAQQLATRKGLLISAVLSGLFCAGMYYLRNIIGMKLPLVIYAGLFFPYLFFYVLGIFIRKGGNIFNNRLVPLGLASLFLIISIIEAILEFGYFSDWKGATSAVRISGFLYSFFLICFLFNKKNLKYESGALSYLGVLSFGIFFLHPLLLRLIPNMIQSFLPSEHIIIQQLSITIFVIMASTAVGALVRKLHLHHANRYLGF